MRPVLKEWTSWKENMDQIFQLFSTEFAETRNVGREVSQEASASESSTQHPCNSNTFVHLVAGDCSFPHRVRMTERHVLGFEKFQ